MGADARNNIDAALGKFRLRDWAVNRPRRRGWWLKVRGDAGSLPSERQTLAQRWANVYWRWLSVDQRLLFWSLGLIAAFTLFIFPPLLLVPWRHSLSRFLVSSLTGFDFADLDSLWYFARVNNECLQPVTFFRTYSSIGGYFSWNVEHNISHKSQYCGKPPWPRGSVLGLRPAGLEFRILCLEDSVISIISPSSGGSPDPV